MHPVEAYKYLGIIIIALAWLIGGVVVYKWPGGKHMSVSRHAASNKTAYYIMAIMQTIGFPILALWVVEWFSPTFHKSVLFNTLNLVMISGFLLAAWVPDIKGIRRRIHELSAYGAAFLMIPICLIILLSARASSLAHLISAVAVIYMLTSFLLFVFKEKVREYHLYFQVVYIALFDVSILVAAYTK